MAPSLPARRARGARASWNEARVIPARGRAGSRGRYPDRDPVRAASTRHEQGDGFGPLGIMDLRVAPTGR